MMYLVTYRHYPLCQPEYPREHTEELTLSETINILQYMERNPQSYALVSVIQQSN